MPTDRIAEAFLGLEAILLRMIAGEAGLTEEALSMVFRLNNEIGKEARSGSRPIGEMRQLQAHVNGITVAVKRHDTAMMKEALESTRELVMETENQGSSGTRKDSERRLNL